MLRNNLDNSTDSKNEDGSVFSQTEHNVVAAYLITAGMDVYSINHYFIFEWVKKSRGFQHKVVEKAWVQRCFKFHVVGQQVTYPF